jgi:predicted ATP-grasp superfamily ATP-dependent carboligase
VDCILKEEKLYPVEVNPRYTASVEVLEHALGWTALAEHRGIFDAAGSQPPVVHTQRSCIGKAILFARAALEFPPSGPWTAALCGAVNELPDYADIPQAGERIEGGSPILTFFARTDTLSSCRDSLQAIAGDLDRWLHER